MKKQAVLSLSGGMDSSTVLLHFIACFKIHTPHRHFRPKCAFLMEQKCSRRDSQGFEME